MTAAQSAGRRRWLALAALVLVVILWSGNTVVARAVRNDIPPFFLALVRWTGALLVVVPFAARHVIADRQRLREGWRPILLLGLTGVVSFNALMYSGLQYTNATNGALLQAAIPPLVLVADRLIFGVRPLITQVIGVVLASIGVLVVVGQGSLAPLFAFRIGFGDLLILAGVLVWALYTSLLRLRPDTHPMSFLSVTFAIAAVAMVPLAATELPRIAAIRWDAGVIGAFLYVALLPSVVAYFLYNAAVAEVGAATAGQAIALLPLFGALLATLLLSEPLHSYHFLGMALISAGICIGWLVTRRAP